LNRLSNDIQVVDQQAAEVMMLFVNSVLNTVAVFVVVSIATPGMQPARVGSASFVVACLPDLPF
jgi:hypothetical protein